MRPGAPVIVFALLLVAPAISAAERVPSGLPSTIGLLQSDGAIETVVALRLRAELEARAYFVSPLSCPPEPSNATTGAAGPARRWTSCLAEIRGPDAHVVIETEASRAVVAWVHARGRTAGPLRLDDGGASQPETLGRFVVEIVAWVDALLVPRPPPNPPSPPAVATVTRVASPEHPAPDSWGGAWSLGLGAVLHQNLSGLGGRYGPELSFGWDLPVRRVFDCAGLRLAAWTSRWGSHIDASGIEVQRAPVIGLVQLTGASLSGRWRFEGHLGAGAEWLSLDARTGAGDSGPALKEGTRFGFLAQGGIAALRALGAPAASQQLLLGLELRVVSMLPRQVVVIGDSRFGDSALPSLAAGAILRWGPASH